MKKRNAFTMIEAIIAIVLFGIIATIGANIISKMYLNYIQARIINYLQTQSEITLEQIAKRLQYRIKNSIVVKSPDGSFVGLSDKRVDETFSVVQWIGYSNEAMLLANGTKAGWSGFIDMSASNKISNTLSTPGSELNSAAAIMQVLSGKEVDLTSEKPAALIFKSTPVGGTVEEGYGWTGTGTVEYRMPVYIDNSTTLKVSGNVLPATIYEQYYLAHSAYAITYDEVIAGTETDFKLNLVYNYQPWNNKKYNSEDVSVATLAENVNIFRIKQVGTAVRLKLCLHDGNRSGLGRNIVACKEEVVL